MKFFTKKLNPLIVAIILATAFGFTAGIIGGALTIKPEVPTSPADGSGSSAVPELIKLRRFLGLKQDLQAQVVAEAVKPTLVGFYSQKIAAKDALSQIYKTEDFLGNGFIITSDGWLVSTDEVFRNVAKQGVVALVNNRAYEVEEIIKDSLSEVVFIKIRTVNLPVVKLGQPEEIELGQSVLVLNALKELAVTHIKSLNYQKTESVLKSTEKLDEFILINDDLSKKYRGAVLVNLDGEVIGIVTGSAVTPVSHFKSVIESVLKSGQAERPLLGVNYLDLSAAPGLKSDLSRGRNRGALIYQNPKAKTPAALAGLRKNDIIVEVDGQLISARRSLTDLIQSYQAGDLVYLTVLRAGQEFTVEVYLEVL